MTFHSLIVYNYKILKKLKQVLNYFKNFHLIHQINSLLQKYVFEIVNINEILHEYNDNESTTLIKPCKNYQSPRDLKLLILNTRYFLITHIQ